jgi:hypothetical protein
MPVQFRNAPEVKEIAEAIIPEHHPHLDDAVISYIFRSEHEERNGRTVWGTARHPTGILAYYSRADFIIDIAEDIWFDLTEAQQLALVDHELSHCVEGKKGWEIQGHDIEEFESIIDRHGLYTPCRHSFGQKCLEVLARDDYETPI